MLELLRKKPTDVLLELGGGDLPVVHPRCMGGQDVNVDVRVCTNHLGQQTVDFAADFDEPLPINSNEFDGVVSKFAAEHVSWRKLPQFIAESFRVLKPGGTALFITPNTEAQLKWIQDHPNGWDKNGSFGDCSCLLFGDLNYLENSHKSYFSPALAKQLFEEAGFITVQVKPFGTEQQQTDMVILADKPTQGKPVGIQQDISGDVVDGIVGKKVENSLSDQAPTSVEEKIQAVEQTMQVKEVGGNIVVSSQTTPQTTPQSPNHAGLSSEERAKLFGRDYFDGGRKYGGYAPPGYRDFPMNEVIARRILEKKPKSVLELGCGRGYVLKRLQDAGVEAEGLDISKHAQMTRVCEHFYRVDALQLPWIPSRGEFDLCFSQDFWQYIPEEFVSRLLAEMGSKCKRGLHGINFGDSYDGFDKLVCCLKPRDWWLEKMPAGHEIKSSTEMASGPFPQDVLKGDGKTKLAIGGFTTMFHYGWTNVGEADLGPQFAQPNGYNYLRWDCRNGVPCQTRSVDLIFLPHYLQRLSYTEGLAFLRDCRRVLKPDGAMRILVPDANQIMNAYEGWFKELEEISPSIEAASTLKQKQWEMLGNGQQSMYDTDSLHEQLQSAGFESRTAPFRHSSLFPANGPGYTSQIIREVIEVGVSYAVFVDAIPKVG